MRAKTAGQLLNEYVTKGTWDECWPWKGSKTIRGYGQVRYEGRTWKAHRLSFDYHNGTIPEGMEVCHECDNPSCCNPKHLFLGTHKDNMTDMKVKKRYKAQKGIANGRAVLTEIDVAKIRMMYQSGVRRKDIAKEFGISSGHVRTVAIGLQWTNLSMNPMVIAQEQIAEQLKRIADALENLSGAYTTATFGAMPQDNPE